MTNINGYNISDFNIEIISKINTISDGSMRPIIKSTVSVNGYKFEIGVSYTREQIEDFKFYPLTFEKNIDNIIKHESIICYLKNILVIRKEKIEKIKKRI